ncbi:AIPR protein [Flavobacterium tiangeerense]|uniref:AIPR protein n=1 Tax=Flavobacterium tiangeerense TaxID=459471 RepID=A0ABY3FNW9_9FLAO|nr:AIPR family protein [Flavobacterium tiangeerense]TWI03265.1 AIPR protein [Flavobacterium tiangeerense]
MTLRQQIVQDHIDKTAIKLDLTADNAFLIFAHSVFTDISIHSFDENDNVDGGQDKQIDAITIEDTSDEATIYITQIKNEETFSSNCIIQIRNGLQWIFEKKQADIDTLTNIRFKDRIKDYRTLQSSLGPSNINVKVAYITKGQNIDLSAEAKQEIKTITDTYDNGTFASFTFETIGADEIVDVLNSQEKKNKKINCEVKIIYDTNNPSLIKYHSKGLKGIICSATASEIAQIVNTDVNGFVFDLNIRKYLGKLGGVNKDILNTCTNSNLSPLFWFLNNGVTIICDKVDPVTDPDDPKVKIENMQIVNGCQTATSLANALKEGHLQPDTRLLLRIYETNDLDLVDKIVLTTNNQNKITGRNLRANDITQLDLEKGFSMFNFSLERKPRQYENTSIPKDNIIPNEDVAVSYLALVLKKPSDARSRKYKVWNEYYDKIFSGTDIIEPYLLSVLIHRKSSEYLLANYSKNADDTIRYLSKNASFHISRISSFLWRGGDNWTNTGNLKAEINSYVSNKNILDTHISNAIVILSNIVKSNPKYIADLNNSLKSADIDNEISKKLHTNHKPNLS